MTSDRELEGVLTQCTLLQYQSDAVVSRTILKAGGGSVTAFAFDGGQELSEHMTPFEALVLIVEGEAEISLAGTPFRVSSGQLLRLPGGQPHAVKALTRLKMILVMIRA
jgi:quercetin dioxygenase-like cupin family protein